MFEFQYLIGDVKKKSFNILLRITGVIEHKISLENCIIRPRILFSR